MYGFTGYGTNSYASRRTNSSFLVRVVRLATTVLRSTYNVVITLFT